MKLTGSHFLPPLILGDPFLVFPCSLFFLNDPTLSIFLHDGEVECLILASQNLTSRLDTGFASGTGGRYFGTNASDDKKKPFQHSNCGGTSVTSQNQHTGIIFVMITAR